METVEAIKCPAEPKVDPRVKRTRTLLEDAFRDLIRERHFSEISVADITDRATVNRATFYAHFEDKAHLANTVLQDDLHQALLKAIHPGSPFNRESLIRLAVATFEFLGRIHSNCPKAAKESEIHLGATIQGGIQSLILHWFQVDRQALKHFPPTTPEAVATVLSWSIYGAAVRWNSQIKRPTAELAAKEVIDLLMVSRTSL